MQIIVYAGAIMVLFLFVIMLLGVDREEALVERLRGQRPLAIVLGHRRVRVELVVAIRAGVGFATKAPADFDETVEPRRQRRRRSSRVLFRDYFFPFEVTSVLLIVAASPRWCSRTASAARSPAPSRQRGRRRAEAEAAP